ncbi:MAG: TRAP transporter large permease subunit, partial [Campylobacterales bacterium]
MIALAMFVIALVLLLSGVPVAFVFGGVALLFALLVPELGLQVFSLLPFRIFGIMGNTTLMAVPLFIAMGLVLEKSRMAENLLETMSALFGSVRGGLAVSVVLVGAILAASTGIVSASVVMMSIIALPLMLNAGYDKGLASGTVAASGTLGQIIPPSIILIILGDVMNVSVGELFMGAVLPGLLLVGLYIVY